MMGLGTMHMVCIALDDTSPEGFVPQLDPAICEQSAEVEEQVPVKPKSSQDAPHQNGSAKKVNTQDEEKKVEEPSQ